MFKVPENYRLKKGLLASDETFGCNGIFNIPMNHNTITAQCLVSDGAGFEHVSVTLLNKKVKFIPRCPTWEEMCIIKDTFWDKEDCVIQYHPPASQYISNHPYCLHLWRPTDIEIPIPPMILVGTKKKLQ